MGLQVEDGDGFHDYTIATTLEKLISSIEHAIRQILAQDLARDLEHKSSLVEANSPFTARLHHRLPFRTEAYCIRLILPSQGVENGRNAYGTSSCGTPTASAWPLTDQPHKLLEWFYHWCPCFVISPESYSGRVLEEEEAQTLLSAGIVALNHLKIEWPILVPIHDPLRDAYRGAALLSDDCGVLRLESDSVHSSSLFSGLEDIEAQMSLFASRLRTQSPVAADVCLECAAALRHHHHHHDSDGTASGSGTANGTPFSVKYALRTCYQVSTTLGIESEVDERVFRDNNRGHNVASFELVTDTWDEDAPWRPWAAEDDPIGGLEVDALWRSSLPEGAAALQTARQEGYPLTSAHAWRLVALRRDYIPDTGRRPLILLQAVDQRRQFLRLQSILTSQMPPHKNKDQDDLAVDVDLCAALFRCGHALDEESSALNCETSFSAMLHKMIEQSDWVSRAQDGARLATDEWWLQQGNYVPEVPGKHVLQDAIRDIFDAPNLPVLWPGTRGPLSSQIVGPGAEATCSNTRIRREHQGAGPQGDLKKCGSSRAAVGKAAPLTSITTRLALHAMRLGNPRATAMLWDKFTRELRFAHWEPAIQLPRTFSAPTREGGSFGIDESPGVLCPDLSCCLLEQKVQLLQMCIRARNVASPYRADAIETNSGAVWAKPGLRNRDDDDAVRAGVNGDDDDIGHNQKSPLLDTSKVSCENNNISREEDSSDDLTFVSAATGSGSSSETPGTGTAAGPGSNVSNQASEDSCWVESVATALQGCDLPSDDYPEDSSHPTSKKNPGSEESGSAGLVELPPPEGVSGPADFYLLHHPLRRMNVPFTQSAPPCTEDVLMERVAAAHAARTFSSTSATWMHAEGALLLSDMQAFKAANPGCCMEDFVRWHSPKDLIMEEDSKKRSRMGWRLSDRMAGAEAPWAALWSAAVALPACRQKPLFEPSLEGERALHFLEALSPASLHAQLLSLGFSAALGHLELVPAAKLPVVKSQIDGLRQVAHAWLGDAGVAAPKETKCDVASDNEAIKSIATSSTPAVAIIGKGTAPTPIAVGGAGTHDVLDEDDFDLLGKGVSMHSMMLLVNMLSYVEQTVVAAQSILTRLTPPPPPPPPPPDDEEYNDKINGGFHGDVVSSAWTNDPPQSGLASRAANALVAAALGQKHDASHPVSTPAHEGTIAATFVDLSAEEAASLASSICYKVVRGDNDKNDGGGAKPIAIEWSVELDTHSSRASDGTAAITDEDRSAGGGIRGRQHMPRHRLYVRRLPGELRVATAMTSEF